MSAGEVVIAYTVLQACEKDDLMEVFKVQWKNAKSMRRLA
jgi:hypothetical protein